MAPAAICYGLTTLVLVNASLAAKVTRMNLYVRGIERAMLLLVAVGWRGASGAGSAHLAVAQVRRRSWSTGSGGGLRGACSARRR